tara:strand:+ start:9110 stop:10198 length:1089 start_codon:yes stop_codon:yes gene_type:complete
MKKNYEIPSWILSYRENIWDWFKTIRMKENQSFIRLCSHGDLLKPSENSGLGWTALGLKLAHMLNFFEYDPTLKDQLTSRIKSFQVSKGENSGYFEDRGLLKKADKFNFRKFKFEKDFNARRSETRQAIVSLECVNEEPLHYLRFMMNSEIKIKKFIRDLPWNTNPWHAGSHTSHLVVFLKTNYKLSSKKAYLSLIDIVFEELDKCYNKKIGSWFFDNPADHQKVNSAMKVYTAYDYINREIPNPEKLIDYCLNVVVENGACNLVDLLYVFYIAQKKSNYRKSEIDYLAFKALETIKQHIQEDGGLAYSNEGTQRRYLGPTVSKGKKYIGDLHGTKLFTWAIVLTSFILGWNKKLNYKLPIT